MPRKLIIALLVLLILVIIGGTASLVWRRLGGSSESSAPPETATLPDSRPIGDSGGVRPQASGQPALPGEAQPELPEAPLQVDQFFQESATLVLEEKDYTKEYKNRFSEEEQSVETLKTYIKEQKVTTNLPAIQARDIATSNSDAPAALSRYLKALEKIIPLLSRESSADVVANVLADGNVSAAESLAWSLRVNRNKLSLEQVPPAALPLHKLLIGYMAAAEVTFNEMASFTDDPVKAMVAVHQLDELDRVYQPLIRREIARLSVSAQ